jgi:phosphatidylinositol alpha-1,6-mannosyltransferase
VPSLLVTNDFPPKVGGIQSYLYELWRRLPPEETTVLTTPHRGARAWDAEQSFRVERVHERVLLPSKRLARNVDALAREVKADIILLDPMLPLGMIGAWLTAAPNVVIVHGAEITVPGRLPMSRSLAEHVLEHAAGIVAAGSYPAREAMRAARRPVPTLIVPPGVDVARFHVLEPDARAAARARFGIAPQDRVVLGVSRLVPRKGFDTLIDSVAALDADVQLVLAGSGRDAHRLRSLAERRGIGGRVRMLGRVPDDALPALYASADLFAMLCRDRWGGLEAEGFGIVFLEAAACGVPAVAGRSGGSHEAVADGVTGAVVDPRSGRAIRAALDRILGNSSLRAQLGEAARQRAVTEFSYDHLVQRLLPITRGDLSCLSTEPTL